MYQLRRYPRWIAQPPHADTDVSKEYLDVCISLDNIQGGYWIAWSPHADADVSKDYLDVCISMDDIQGGQPGPLHADTDVIKDYLDVCISMDDIHGGELSAAHGDADGDPCTALQPLHLLHHHHHPVFTLLQSGYTKDVF